MAELPSSVIVRVNRALASDLFRAAVALPPHEDKALYSLPLQKRITESLRKASANGWDALIEKIRLRLVQRPYFAYIKGLQFDHANLLLVGLTGAFGEVVDPYDQDWSRLVRCIRPSTDRAIAGRGILNENPHTDGTDWPCPNDLTCLLCVRPDQDGGGRSRLISLPTVFEELEKQIGTSAIAQLRREAVPWRIADELGGGTFMAPIFEGNQIRWLYHTIRISIDEGLACVSEETNRILLAMGNCLTTVVDTIDFMAQPGSLIIVHNKRCLHCRTSISRPQISTRLVLRTKILRSKTPSVEWPPAWKY